MRPARERRDCGFTLHHLRRADPGAGDGSGGQPGKNDILLKHFSLPKIAHGSWLLAAYPRLQARFFSRGDFGDLTLPRLFKVNDWLVIAPLLAIIALLFFLLERAGL